MTGSMTEPSRLVPLPGDGRLLRTDDYILFTAADEPELLRVLASAPDLFKALAEYIVKRSFGVTDLALIGPTVSSDASAAWGSAMLFGDVSLASSTGVTSSAATTSTWLEVGLAGEDIVVGTPAAFDQLGPTPPDVELDLQRGYVAAGGFVLARTSPGETVDWLTSLLGSTVRIEAEPEPEPGVDNDLAVDGPELEGIVLPRAARPSTVPLRDALDEDDSLLDPLADPSGFDLDRLGSEPSIVFTSAGHDGHDRHEGDDGEDGDAAGNEAGEDTGDEVDPPATSAYLAEAERAPALAVPEPPDPVQAGPAPEITPDATPPLADHPPPPVRPPPGIDGLRPPAPGVGSPAPPTGRPPAPAGVPPAPVGLPPTSPPPPPPPSSQRQLGNETLPPETLPPPPSGLPSQDPRPQPLPSVRLRFDDGQSVEVSSGLYVGRHPTKSGLPNGFDAVTIRGEQVSRRHWQLVVADGQAMVSDLGSAAGTGIERPGQAEVPITGSVAITAGDTIRFADRWARIEVAVDQTVQEELDRP